MKKHIEKKFTGERALFQSYDLNISYCTFEDGESPLKESSNLEISNSLFKWKYPLWYCNNVTMKDSVMFEMARAGIWYTNKLNMNNVTVKGDYFAMGSSDIEIDGFTFVGNYSFDGVKNLTIRNAKMLSKDAFWNSENVTVYDSFLSGEYLGWNSKNVTLINCTIESLQGMCYMENVVLKKCKLLNTNLAFEYSTVEATVDSSIESIKNPYSGKIVAKSVGEVIFDNSKMKVENTEIITENGIATWAV